MKEITPESLDNSKLLKLLDAWVKSDGSKKSYEKVMVELRNDNAFLIAPTNEKVDVHLLYTSTQSTKSSMPFYEVEGNKYLVAFTDLDLFNKWAEKDSFQIKVPSKTLLETVDKNAQLYGIIINTTYRNMFVVFPKTDT
jgi:hypothetical protein